MHMGLILGFWCSRSFYEGGAIQFTINLLIPYDGLNILARLSKRNGFHELVEAVIVPCRAPIRHALIACVVCGECVLLMAAEFIERLPEIPGAEPDVDRRIE